MLIERLVIDEFRRVFLHEHLGTDGLMDGFRPVILWGRIENKEKFPEVGLKVEPAILDGLLGQRINAQFISKVIRSSSRIVNPA